MTLEQRCVQGWEKTSGLHLLHDSLSRLESQLTPEIIASVENYQGVWHGHGHQPKRKLQFAGEPPVYDISGVGQLEQREGWATDKGWNEIALQESVFAMAYPIVQQDENGETKIFPSPMSSPYTSVNLYGPIRNVIMDKYPEHWDVIKPQLQEKLPFADSYFHNILPLMPDQVKELLIQIGIEAYERDIGIKSKNYAFWPAELGINGKTADILAQNGVRFLILGRNQIMSPYESAPLYIHETTDGLPLIIFPYNCGLSNHLAFKDISSAPTFAGYMENVRQIDGFSPLIANDLETIGHQRKIASLWFYNYLINEIIPKKIAGGSLDYKRTIDMARPGKIKDSSWSCEHPTFGRWGGNDDCCYCGQVDHETKMQRRQLYEGLRDEVEDTLGRLNQISLMRGYDWQPEFKEWFLRERFNLVNGRPVTLDGVKNYLKDPFKDLLTELCGLQSCAWFFDQDYERTMAIKTLNYLQQKRQQSPTHISAVI